MVRCVGWVRGHGDLCHRHVTLRMIGKPVKTIVPAQHVFREQAMAAGSKELKP